MNKIPVPFLLSWYFTTPFQDVDQCPEFPQIQNVLKDWVFLASYKIVLESIGLEDSKLLEDLSKKI